MTVNISVKNNPGICAAKVTISYDGNTLELKKAENGSILGGYIPGPVTNNPIALTWATLEDSTANGVLATLTFTVKENADSGKSAITLTYVSGTYLSVYPRLLAAGSKLVVEAATEGYVIKKEIVLSNEIDLETGKITTLNVNLSDEHITAAATGRPAKGSGSPG